MLHKCQLAGLPSSLHLWRIILIRCSVTTREDIEYGLLEIAVCQCFCVLFAIDRTLAQVLERQVSIESTCLVKFSRVDAGISNIDHVRCLACSLAEGSAHSTR